MNKAKLALVSIMIAASSLSAATLVTVNGKPITTEDVNQVLMGATQGRFKTLPIDKQKELQKRILKDMITEQVIYDDAVKMGIEKSREFKKSLAIATKQLKKRIALQLWQKKEADKIKVTEKEVTNYYTQNKDEFKEPTRVHARHILVKTQEEAQKLINEMKGLKGEALKDKFISLAEADSTGPSASKGGDLGTFTKGQMVPAFDKAVFAMKVGTITQHPVKTQFGYHIIYLQSKKEAVTLPLKAVKRYIEQRIKMDKFRTIIRKKVTELKAAAKIVPAQGQ
jgi:peptidyl-prolyl cis-trans isomerase C